MGSVPAPPSLILNRPAYAALALVSAAVIAYELFVMRVFANGGWSHFGSTVVSIALFGFGVFSTVLCLWNKPIIRRLPSLISLSLLLLGPLMAAANSAAQHVPFNPMFLVSDPRQKYYLALDFLIYFLPFLAGAMFIGLCFVAGRRRFGQVYFANMSGSGLGGLVFFAALYAFLPENLYAAPLALWAAGALLWFLNQGRTKLIPVLVFSVAAAAAVSLGLEQINVSQYKGVSYARKFPDARRVHLAGGPFGRLEVYKSSYFHFAPGLSDSASLYLEEMPKEAYLGLYIDGDGPIGLMKNLTEKQAEYIRFLPMAMPYLLKKDPAVLVMQFGGGISTNVALKMGASRVTVAEGNPMIVRAVRDNPYIARFTGRILENPKVELRETDGRIIARQALEAYDVVDLSLADSTGLSMPGGYAIHEKYLYTRETFTACLRALKKDGLLSVTIWNKEDPPKSTLKLMNTMIQAARTAGAKDPGRCFFIAHTFLSTLSVLYKKGGFQPDEVQALLKYCRKMSFEVLHHPGRPPAEGDLEKMMKAYHGRFFNPEKDTGAEGEVDLSAGRLYQLAADRFLRGESSTLEHGYVFDVKPLTDDRPYFAGFIRLGDLAGFLPRLETVSDEWGYLLLWATLLLSLLFGGVLMLLPVVFAWRAFFSGHRGKAGLVVYFLCLGLGYIMVEIGLISRYIQLLGNPTVSITVLITGMLVFSGLGSYFSSRFLDRAGTALAVICPAVAAVLLFFVGFLDGIFDLAGAWSYPAKVLFCLVLLFPPAFLMGFPFATGMATLSNLGREVFFVWAWGINGSFSVAGSVLVPILAVNLGLSRVLILAALLYLLALPAFLYMRRPDRPARA
ncbi:MAG: hypothetical protein AB1896_15040 [Thermodesulfobacteriota bacterium]